MTTTEAIAILKDFRRWNQGDQDVANWPKIAGAAIDNLCDATQRLTHAIESFRDAKGRYHTQKATEKMLALISTNLPSSDGPENRAGACRQNAVSLSPETSHRQSPAR
jgi:hypothetical protein